MEYRNEIDSVRMRNVSNLKDQITEAELKNSELKKELQSAEDDALRLLTHLKVLSKKLEDGAS